MKTAIQSMRTRAIRSRWARGIAVTVTHDPATTVTSQTETQDYTLKLTDITNTTAAHLKYGTAQNDINKAQRFEGYTPGSATCDIPVSPRWAEQYFVWAKDKAGYISAPKKRSSTAKDSRRG